MKKKISLSSKISKINKQFANVADIFGTQSPEYERIKLYYEQSFRNIPVNIGDRVIMKSLDVTGFSSEYTGYIQIDPSAVAHEISKEKGFEKAYEIAIDRALSRVANKTIFKMAKKYTYTDKNGTEHIFKRLSDVTKYKDQIRNIAHIRYKFENSHENLYLAIEELDDDKKANELKEKLKRRGKGYKGALKGFEIEEELIQLLEEQSKRDFYDSKEDDYDYSISAEDMLNDLTIKERR